MRRAVGTAALLLALVLPAQAGAIRYASPTGTSAETCASPAAACDISTAIEGIGGNMPGAGEEIVILTGTYTVNTHIGEGASGLNIHGDMGQPRPQINIPMSIGSVDMNSGTLSYVSIEAAGNAPLTLSGGGVIDRVFLRGSTNQASPLCQCYIGLVRNSVFVSTGTSPAIGVTANGGSGSPTYRNITAYSTNASGSAVAATQQGGSGMLSIDGFNVIALNTGGGFDVVADGPNSSVILSHSNFRTTSTPDGGGVFDGSGGHQTALPLFTNAGAGDFSELPNSPTVGAGLTDPQNGALDFGGAPRSIGGRTDIGAYQYVPAPSFSLGATKIKVKKSGKGSLPFTCSSEVPDSCAVEGTLSAGGTVSGTVAGGTTGTLALQLGKKARKRLLRKGKLSTQLGGNVAGVTGKTTPLNSRLKLKLKGKR